MPRISVVVPVFDVESYLATCLQSLARQTFGDLEVVVVDDGSTDGSAAIAERFASRDPRFRLIRQANGGLGRARNAGVAAASGELIAFVDSDDVLPDRAYERLAGALDASGSDFATGNVLRLTRQGTAQARFLARTFAKTRLRTHVTRDRPLLADRTAWNKLWRRSFWDAQGLAFPEGVIHEDIPVTLPAHLAAATVDVVAAPVYHWRLREDGALSITQRRLELRVLADRLQAIEQVRTLLRERGPRRVARWYDASLVADDLRLHLDVLDQATAEYQELFMAGAERVLASVPARACRRLPAIDRLKWHLVRAGRLDDVLEVIRFEREQGADTPPARRLSVHYGAYPFRDDRARKVPRSAYRLGRRDEDLALVGQVDSVRADGGTLVVRGSAHIGCLPAAKPGMVRTTLTALRGGRLQPLEMRLARGPGRTTPLHRPDLAADGDGIDRSWSGFEAQFDVRDLRSGDGWVDGTWKVFAHTRSGLIDRCRGRFELASPSLIGTVELQASSDVRARATVGGDGTIAIAVSTRWARLARCLRTPEDALEIRCETHPAPAGEATLRLRRRSDGHELRYRLAPAGERWSRADVGLADLEGAPASLEAWAAGTAGAGEMWELFVDAGGSLLPVALPDALAEQRFRHGGVETALTLTRSGDAALVTHALPVAAPVPAVAAPPAVAAAEAVPVRELA